MSRTLKAILLLLPITVASLQGQAGAITGGIVLSKLLDRVNAVLANAQNNGQILVVGAAGQVASAIQMAQTAYRDELNHTETEFRLAHKSLIDELVNKVEAVERKSLADLREIVDHGAVVANTIPLSNKFPQVSRYAPYYFVPSIQNATLLTIDGNFFDAARDGFAPRLSIGAQSQKLEPLTRTTLGLVFSVPAALVQSPGSGVSFVPTKLIVPYRSGLFHSRKEATFEFILAVLPPRAGTLLFHAESPSQSTVRATKQSQVFEQASNDDDIPEGDAQKQIGKQWCAQPDPGWTVNVSSVHPVVQWKQGDQGTVSDQKDWFWVNNTSNALNACWNLTTIHHPRGTSGKVRFVLSFEQTKTVDGTTPSEVTSDLNWASAKRFDIPANGTWRAVYRQFDNAERPINSGSFDNPYLKVDVSGLSVLFSTIP